MRMWADSWRIGAATPEAGTLEEGGQPGTSQDMFANGLRASSVSFSCIDELLLLGFFFTFISTDNLSAFYWKIASYYPILRLHFMPSLVTALAVDYFAKIPEISQKFRSLLADLCHRKTPRFLRVQTAKLIDQSKNSNIRRRVTLFSHRNHLIQLRTNRFFKKNVQTHFLVKSTRIGSIQPRTTIQAVQKRISTAIRVPHHPETSNDPLLDS